jgi:hypothetical protein
MVPTTFREKIRMKKRLKKMFTLRAPVAGVRFKHFIQQARQFVSI